MRATIITVISIASLCMLYPTHDLYAFRSGDIDISPRGRLGGSYDDNITYVLDDRKSDLITELSAGIVAAYEGKKGNASLSADITQNIFAKNSKYDNNSQYLMLDISSDPIRLHHFGLRERFSHVYEPQTFNEAFGITAGRYSYFRNYFGLDYSCDISKQSTAGVSYSNSVDLPARDELDNSYSNSLAIYLAHAFSSSTVISGNYLFNARSFRPGDDAYTHALEAVFKQYLTKQAYLSASCGLDYITSYEGKEYLKPSYKISLADDIDETKKAIITYEKQYDTNAYLEDVFKFWKLSADFIWQLARRLGVFGSVFAGRGTYVESGVKDTLFGGNLGLTYEITRRLRGVLSYRYSISESTLGSNEYVKNTVYLGLKMEF